MMLYCVKIYLEGISSIESLIFYRFPCKNFIFNTLYSLKFSIMIFVPNNWIFATLQKEICRYHDAILCKNIFRGYFIRRTFDFLQFSVLKLHFQHLIFAKILYNDFLSLTIGFLQPYEKKFVDIMMLYCVKIYLEDISSVESLIFYYFPC